LSSIPSSKPITNSLGGKSIIGSPNNNDTVSFDAVSDSFVYIPGGGAFDGKHTSLTDKEIAGVIDHADNSVTTSKINALAITTPKIALLAITTALLNALSVTEPKIAAFAVTVGKIGALAVTQAKLALLSVGTPQLIDLGVTTVKIAIGAVTQVKLALLSVGTPELINVSVTEPKIGALAVTEAKIAALAVSLAKMKTEVSNANLFIGYDGAGVVVAKAGGGGGGLGDLEFLKQQIDLGDFLQARGTQLSSTLGLVAAVTPATGKTYYQIHASIASVASGDTFVTCLLRNDTTIIREALTWGVSVANNTNTMQPTSYFDVLVGNSSKTYDIDNLAIDAAGVNFSGTLEGFLTDT